VINDVENLLGTPFPINPFFLAFLGEKFSFLTEIFGNF
jgi:hypothetical protein